MASMFFRYAGFWRRVSSSAIDYVLIMCVVGGALNAANVPAAASVTVGVAALLVYGPALLVTQGRTVGMRVARTICLMSDGSAIPWRVAFKRAIIRGSVASAVLLIGVAGPEPSASGSAQDTQWIAASLGLMVLGVVPFVIDAAWMVRRSRRQMLHDVWTDSIVVVRPRGDAHPSVARPDVNNDASTPTLASQVEPATPPASSVDESPARRSSRVGSTLGLVLSTAVLLSAVGALTEYANRTTSVDIAAKAEHQYMTAFNAMSDAVSAQLNREDSPDPSISAAAWRAEATALHRYDQKVRAITFPDSMHSDVEAVLAASAQVQSDFEALAQNVANPVRYQSLYSAMLTDVGAFKSAEDELSGELGLTKSGARRWPASGGSPST